MSRRGKSATGELEDAIKEQEQDLSAKGREIRGLSEQARLAQIDIDMKEEQIIRMTERLRVCYEELNSRDSTIKGMQSALENLAKQEKSSSSSMSINGKNNVVEVNRDLLEAVNDILSAKIETSKSSGVFRADTVTVDYGTTQLRLRVSVGFTFRDLAKDCCRFWNLNLDSVTLVDQKKRAWPRDKECAESLGYDPNAANAREPVVELIIRAAADQDSEGAVKLPPMLRPKQVEKKSAPQSAAAPQAAYGMAPAAGAASVPAIRPGPAARPADSGAGSGATLAIMPSPAASGGGALILPPAPAAPQGRPAPVASAATHLLAPEQPVAAPSSSSKKSKRKLGAPEVVRSQCCSFCFYVLFLVCFVLNLQYRRHVHEAFYQNSVIRDAFVATPFQTSPLQVVEEQTTVSTPGASTTSTSTTSTGGGASLHMPDISTTGEFWDWTQKVVQEAIFPETSTQFTIGGYNQIVGGIKVSQWRMNNDTCKILAVYDRFDSGCHASYSATLQSTNYFGSNYGSCGSCPANCGAGPAEAQACKISDDASKRCCSPGFYFVQQKAEENEPAEGLISSYTSSAYSLDFAVGGSAVDYDTKRSDFVTTLARLKQNRWVDKATRAVQIKLLLFNPNYAMFSNVALMVEWTAAGSIVPSVKMSSLKLDSWDNELKFTADSADKVEDESHWNFESSSFRERVASVLVECYIALYILMLMFHMIVKASVTGFSFYFRSMFNLVKVIIICLYISSVTMRAILFQDPTRLSVNADPTLLVGGKFFELGILAGKYDAVFAVDAFTVLLIFAYAFVYFKKTGSFQILFDALSLAINSITSFMVVLFVFVIGFALMANLVYGPYIHEYSQLGWCFGSLFRMLVGDFDYQQLAAANGGITPVFFVLYIGIVYIVMLNIFIAILNESYTKARERFDALGSAPQPGFLISLVRWAKSWFVSRSTQTSINNDYNSGKDVALDKAARRQAAAEEKERLKAAKIIAAAEKKAGKAEAKRMAGELKDAKKAEKSRAAEEEKLRALRGSDSDSD